MKLLFDKVMMLVKEFQVELYVILTVVFIIVGLTLLWSEEGSEKLKKRAPLMVIGFLLCTGAVTLGAQYGASLKF